ncbi:MAG: Gfo/Idh/MocA family oxidoreductase [Candidatus Latescibacteria bacterium]|jgi:predicted dehydrogenase|nr:Gfo/Idh/MocA family oxidoreductase [Candidatus Latescibacterota bacterium]
MSGKNNKLADDFDRRNFLKMGTAAGLGTALNLNFSGCASNALKTAPTPFTVPKIDPVRVGYVGVGGMGTAHVRNLLRIEGVEIRAVCDIVSDRIARAQNLVEEAGQPRPKGYSRGETDFLRLCERDDLDLVYTATPWELHVPVCVAAMEAGKHAATEVPAAVTIDECWQLVETSERTRQYCIMMENCCYDRMELMILHMVRKGMLGEIIHGEAGYLHDLRALKFDFESKGEALWRTKHSIKRDGNPYPTHGLGPIAQCMNINRGDQFDYLVSMSTKSIGLNQFAANKYGPDHKWAKQKFALGDINVSLIRTMNGGAVTLYHDCSSPRPYSRINLVQGTKGIARKWPNRIHIEGKSQAHQWEPLEDYQEEYDHPLWKELNDKSKGAGHGGMDYIEDYRLIKCLREGLPLDMDVYDAACWSAISELSERSVANRSKTMDFPDFTRGTWKTRPPLGIVKA